MAAAVSENASIPHAGDLDEILEQLRSGPVEIVRGDKRAAVVLSPDHFDRLQREADEALVARIKAAEAEGYLGVEASERATHGRVARTRRAGNVNVACSFPT